MKPIKHGISNKQRESRRGNKTDQREQSEMEGVREKRRVLERETDGVEKKEREKDENKILRKRDEKKGVER
jgi:hypothetical protein